MDSIAPSIAIAQPNGELILVIPHNEILDRNLSDIWEIKQPSQYHEVDESLTEWEAARLTSKTWSMEQE